MPRKNQAGCGCCDSCPILTFPDAGDWTDIDVGAVKDDQVNIDGKAKPSSFLDRDAFVVEFDLSGKVTITHETDSYVIDTPNGTLTAFGLTRTFSKAMPSSQYATVTIRFTPTHSVIIVSGRADASTDPVLGQVLVSSRSAAPDHQFEVDSDNAIIRDLTISDGEVIVDPDADSYTSNPFTKNCFTEIVFPCSYTTFITLFKTWANYYADNNAGFPDCTYSGWDFWQERGQVWKDAAPTNTYETTPRVCNTEQALADGDITVTRWSTLPTDDEYRRLATCTCSGFEGNVSVWTSGQTVSGTSYFEIIELANQSTPNVPSLITVEGTIEYIYPDPTYDEPYPLPVCRVTLTTSTVNTGECTCNFVDYDWRYSSTLLATLEFSPNDLQSGFTLSATGSGSFVVYNWPPPSSCLVDPGPGFGVTCYHYTPSYYSYGDASLTWTFSP